MASKMPDLGISTSAPRRGYTRATPQLAPSRSSINRGRLVPRPVSLLLRGLIIGVAAVLASACTVNNRSPVAPLPEALPKQAQRVGPSPFKPSETTSVPQSAPAAQDPVKGAETDSAVQPFGGQTGPEARDSGSQREPETLRRTEVAKPAQQAASMSPPMLPAGEAPRKTLAPTRSPQAEHAGSAETTGLKDSAEGELAKPVLPVGTFRSSAAYQVPKQMIEGRNSPVDLWIDPSVSSTELYARLESYLFDNARRTAERRGTPGNVQGRTLGDTAIVTMDILAGKKMFATLAGKDFEIEPEGSQERTLIPGQPMKWSWIVKPKIPSEEGLLLELRVMADPGEGSKPIETIREVVVVKARPRTPMEKLQELDLWIKLLGGGGIGAAGLWVARRVVRALNKEER